VNSVDIDEDDNLKEQLLELVDAFENEDGMDLSEEHPLFRWGYPERPDIEFQLLIKKVDSVDMMPLSNTIH
jgi:hypothetical protein